MKKQFLAFKILSLLIFLSLYSFSQTQDWQNKIKEKMWGDNDPDFSITKVDDKYKNESAVILCRSIEYEVKKEILFTYLYENYYFRDRVMVLDNAAVKEYSEFDFNITNSYLNIWGSRQYNYYIGIKVIKKNGSENEIDIDEAILDEIRKGFYKEKSKKIAIPDLESGDIIDYYYVKRRMIKSTYKAFDPVMYTLVANYPIIKQKIELHAMRKCYINVASVNNAPKLKKTNSKRSDITYTLIDENRNKVEPERWQYPFRSLPTLKFQAFYFGAAPTIVPFVGELLSKSGPVRTKFTKNELLGLLNNFEGRWRKSYQYDVYAGNNFLKTKFKKTTDPEKIARELYYFFRERFFGKNFERKILDMEGRIFEDKYRDRVNELEFTAAFSSILKKKKIPHQIFITARRELSSLEDIILPGEIMFGVILKSKKTLFITNYSRLSLMDEINPELYGNKAYAVDVLKKTSERTIKEITIPYPSTEENVQTTKSTINLNLENIDSTLISREIIVKGDLKFLDQLTYINPYDYIFSNKSSKYEYNKAIETATTKKKEQALRKKIRHKKEQDKKERFEYHEKSLQNSFDDENLKLKKFELIKFGIWEEFPDLVYKDELTSTNLISKMGNNYLFEAGKLIGGQIALEEKDMNRASDVYREYTRSFVNNIEITIPEGYEPAGLDELNMNISNNTGGFISSAIFENGKIIIHTKKDYLNIWEPKENWEKMTEFLEAAYNFQQKKILLKKL